VNFNPPIHKRKTNNWTIHFPTFAKSLLRQFIFLRKMGGGEIMQKIVEKIIFRENEKKAKYLGGKRGGGREGGRGGLG